jgi:hypothetical protein
MEFFNINLTKDLSLLLHASGQSLLASTGGFYRKLTVLHTGFENPYKKYQLNKKTSQILFCRKAK